MKRLRVTDFGPLREADVKFGDLTVLVGPQASGKSLFVQLYKLIEDAPAIAEELERYGFDWRDDPEPLESFSSIYFGGGLEGIFGKTTKVIRETRRVDPRGFALDKPNQLHERVFLIPAQRVLVLQDGWPKPFMGYEAIKKGEGKGQISATNPTKILGSVAIDDDCRASHPHANRWDYVVGYEGAKQTAAHFIEVQSAETSEVGVVEKKFQWLLDFLAAEGHERLRAFPAEFYWVASGRINIPRHTPQYRKLHVTLRKRGLKFAGKTLVLR